MELYRVSTAVLLVGMFITACIILLRLLLTGGEQMNDNMKEEQVMESTTSYNKNTFTEGYATIPIRHYKALILELAELQGKMDRLITIEYHEGNRYVKQATLQAKLNPEILNDLVAEKMIDRGELGNPDWEILGPDDIWWSTTTTIAKGPEYKEPEQPLAVEKDPNVTMMQTKKAADNVDPT